MIRTCKQLENKLNTINNTTDIKIKKRWQHVHRCYGWL